MKINKIIGTILAAMLCLSLAGAAAVSEERDVTPVMQNVSYGTVDVDDREIVLEFDLDYKDEIAKTLSAKDIELDYGFHAMTIKSINWNNDLTFNITLDGKIDRNFETAQVRLLTSAFTGDRDPADITFDIVKPQMFIDYDDISFTDGVLSLPVTLYQCEFVKTWDISHITLTGDVPFTVSGLKITNAENAVVELLTEGFDDIDSALKAVSNASLVISGKALTTINGTTMSLDMPFNEVIPTIEETAPNEDGTVQVLCRLIGSEKTLDSSLISLGGGFADKEAAFTISETGETLISFKVKPDGVNLTSGTITLAAGALTNPWGTPSEKFVYTRSISYDDIYGEETAEPEDGDAVATAALGFVPFDEIGEYSFMPYEETADLTYSEMGLIDIVGSLGPAANVFMIAYYSLGIGLKIASVAGYLPDGNAQTAKALNGIEGEISSLTALINNLSVDVSVENAKTRVQNFNRDLTAMNETRKQFYNEFDSEVRKLILEPSAEKALAGEIFDNYSQTEKDHAIREYERAYPIFKANKRLTKVQILEYFGGQYAYPIIFAKAAEKIGPKYYNTTVNGNRLTVAYITLCKQVSGGSYSQSILTDVDCVINGTYNWEGEAYPKRADYRAMIQARLYELGNFVDICMSTYDYDLDKSDAANAYTEAINYITTGAGLTRDRKFPSTNPSLDFCVTLNRKFRIVGALNHDREFADKDQLMLLKMRTNRLGRTLAEDFKAAGLILNGEPVTYLAAGPIRDRTKGFQPFGYTHWKNVDAYRMDDRGGIDLIDLEFYYYNLAMHNRLTMSENYDFAMLVRL
ncbi:MAG: hypothetical protein LBL98_01525 [Ruminococcus sp.]|jgi:hypothetical protein|nr:hypothetical protein [Ruminococcus sp.]